MLSLQVKFEVQEQRMGMLQFCAWNAHSPQGSHFNENYKNKKSLSIHLESSSTKSHISEDTLLIAV